jgi:two-component system, chemotaxis family, protein-glutamate methylesterase/glutaminase
VVVGASAGGVEALVRFVASLPPGFPPAVLVVLHVSASGTSVLASILARAGRLPVATAQDGEPLAAGRVYVAPPDHHLLVADGHVRLTQTPRENGHRPAVDPTMRSAARAAGGRTAGVILSGSRDDGTAGLLAIKRSGGIGVVQDPEEALYEGMPRNAIEHVDVDAVLRVDDIAAWLQGSAIEARGEDHPPEGRLVDEHPRGEGTRFTCPDCGGVLFEHVEGTLVRFACSVGHAYSIEALAAGQGHELENALWAAVRALEDRAVLLARLAERARGSQQQRSAKTFASEAVGARERSQVIREAISHVHAGSDPIAAAIAAVPEPQPEPARQSLWEPS